MSTLSDAAALMSAGEWRVICTNGDASNYGNAIWPAIPVSKNTGYKIYDFSAKCLYDPGSITGQVGQSAQKRRVYYKGGAHITGIDPPTEQVLCIGQIAYDIESNHWSKLALNNFDNDYTTGSGGAGNVHMYNLQAFNPSTRQWFYQYSGSSSMIAIDTDQYDPVNIADANYPQIYAPSSGGFNGNYGAIETFPERNSIMFFESTAGYIWEKKLNEETFSLIYPIPSWGTPFGSGMFYNPKYKIVMFGGAVGQSAGNLRWWAYKADGSIVTLHDAPENMYFSNVALGFVDAVSGKLCVIIGEFLNNVNEVHFWEYDYLADTWTRRTDLEAAIPDLGVNGDGTTNRFYPFDCVCCDLPDLGVAIFLGWKVWIYKHTDNTLATDGLSFAGLQAYTGGKVGAFGFDAHDDLKMGWDQTDTTLSTAVAAAGYTTHYLISTDRAIGEGNAQGTVQLPGVTATFPVIDNTTYSSETGGTGALKFAVPTLAGRDVGYYQANFDGNLGQPSIYFSPTSPNGRVYYFQFRLRINDVMKNTAWRTSAVEYDGVDGGGHALLTTGSAGDTHVTLYSGIDVSNRFTAGMAGRKFMVFNNNGNFVVGYYDIVSVEDAFHLTLATSPTPSAAGNGGYATIGGEPVTKMWNGTLTCAHNSTTLVRSGSIEPFTSDMVGLQMVIRSSQPAGGLPGFGTNFDGGVYTISSFTDSSHIVLNSTPASGGAATGGYGKMGSLGLGWKVVIQTDNPPLGLQAGETVENNNLCLGYPQLYADRGNSGAFNQIQVPYEIDQFQTHTIRTEIKGIFKFATASGGSKALVATVIPGLYDPFWSGIAGGSQQYYMVIKGTTNGLSTGRATFVSVSAGGSGYSNSTGVAVTGGTGTGCTVNITTSGGAVTAATINNPGHGYDIGQTLTVSGGGGNATLNVTTVDIYFVDSFTDTKHVTVHVSPTPDSAGSGVAKLSQAPITRVTEWIDGVLATDWNEADVIWFDVNDPIERWQTGSYNAYPLGRGQFQLLPYHTILDSSFTHSTGYMWFDDLIISTQPPLMVAGSGTSPGAPTKQWLDSSGWCAIT